MERIDYATPTMIDTIVADFCKDYNRRTLLQRAKEMNMTPTEYVMSQLPHNIGKTDGTKIASIILDRYDIDDNNPFGVAPAKVYIVMENCRTKHSDETTEVLSVHSSRAEAEKVVKINKFNPLSEWKDLMEDDEDEWETEIDETDNFTLARVSDYEYYYSVWIMGKTLEP